MSIFNSLPNIFRCTEGQGGGGDCCYGSSVAHKPGCGHCYQCNDCDTSNVWCPSGNGSIFYGTETKCTEGCANSGCKSCHSGCNNCDGCNSACNDCYTSCNKACQSCQGCQKYNVCGTSCNSCVSCQTCNACQTCNSSCHEENSGYCRGCISAYMVQICITSD